MAADKQKQIEALEHVIFTKEVNNEKDKQYYKNLLQYLKTTERDTSNAHLHWAITKSHPHSYYGGSLKWLWIWNGGTEESYKNWLKEFELKNIKKNTFSRPRKAMIVGRKSRNKDKIFQHKKVEKQTFELKYIAELKKFEKAYNKLNVLTTESKKVIKPNYKTLMKNIMKVVNGDKPSNDCMILLTGCILVYHLAPLLSEQNFDLDLNECDENESEELENTFVFKEHIAEWAPILWNPYLSVNNKAPIDRKRTYLCLKPSTDNPKQFEIIDIFVPVYKALYSYPNKGIKKVIENANSYLEKLILSNPPQISIPKPETIEDNSKSAESKDDESEEANPPKILVSKPDPISESKPDPISESKPKSKTDQPLETKEAQEQESNQIQFKDVIMKIKLENIDNVNVLNNIEIAMLTNKPLLLQEFMGAQQAAAKFSMSIDIHQLSKLILNKVNIVASSKQSKDLLSLLSETVQPVSDNQDGSKLSWQSKEWNKNIEWDDIRAGEFEKELNEMGMTMVVEASDNSCLFHAIGRQVYEDAELYKIVQDCVVSYMGENIEKFEGFLTDDISMSEYLEKARKTGKWGGNLEIQAAANIYDAEVTIFYGKADFFSIVKPTPGIDAKNKLRFVYCSGTHYNSVLPIKHSGSILRRDDVGVHEATKLNECSQINWVHSKKKDTDVKEESMSDQIDKESENQDKNVKMDKKEWNWDNTKVDSLKGPDIKQLLITRGEKKSNVQGKKSQLTKYLKEKFKVALKQKFDVLTVVQLMAELRLRGLDDTSAKKCILVDRLQTWKES
eukprot:450392_1